MDAAEGGSVKRPAGTLLALALLSLGGCNAPKAFRIASFRPAPDAFDCSAAELSKLGYTIEAGDKDVGFIRGEKAEGGNDIFSGDQNFRVLKVAVFTADGQVWIRVTAFRQAQNDKGERKNITVQGGVESDARAVLTACGKGEVEKGD